VAVGGFRGGGSGWDGRKVFTRPEDLIADLEQTVAHGAVKVANEVTNVLYIATPVDTTHAQNNWIPSIGAPYVGVDGSRESPSFAEQSAGLAALVSYQLGMGDIFVTNNVEYMTDLDENGSSPQAPAGFVGVAVERALDNIMRGLRVE